MSALFISFFMLLSIPLVLAQPVLAPVVYYWLVWMHPETQTFGGLNWRWTFIIAIAALISTALRAGKWQIPKSALVPLLIIFLGWYAVATWVNPGTSFALVNDFSKVILMCIVSACVLSTRVRLHAVIWVVAICIGFVAIRTAAITLLSGGGSPILGPAHLGESNEFARVLLYTFPLVLFLAHHSAHAYVRLGLFAMSGSLILSVFGTNSRGGFVALIAVLGIIWIKGNHRLGIALGILSLVIAGLILVPERRLESFTSRMSSIENPNEDNSFSDRTVIWQETWDFAQKSPVFGGGAGFSERVLLKASHNSYVEVLGETGFVGLAIWALIAVTAIAESFRIRRLSKGIADLRWAYDLAYYLQLSFVGYFVGGIVKNHGFFEYYYMLIAIMLGTGTAVRNYLISQASEEDRLLTNRRI